MKKSKTKMSTTGNSAPSDLKKRESQKCRKGRGATKTGKVNKL